MATLRELKGRIGSVRSSEKITGAMKMISSAKMHKYEQALRRLLPFRAQLQSIMGNLLSTDAEFSSPLIETREVKSVGIVVFGSDDGLCGAFNINIFKGLLQHIEQKRQSLGNDTKFVIYAVGNKMYKATSRLADSNIKVIRPDNITAKSQSAAIKDFTKKLQTEFLSGDLDTVDILYMKFHSVSRQRLEAEQLLPVSQTTLTAENIAASSRPCIFEPGPDAIFSSVLPLFILAIMQETFTQNLASEQASRIMAMQSANDNAKKLLEQLQLEYNKLRQQSITTELLDILGGQIR